MMHDDYDDLREKLVCFHCVGESYLQEQIQQTGQKGRCSYCERVEPGFSTEKLAELVEQAFERHYLRTADQPNSWQVRLLSDKESDYDWDRDGEPVIWTIANAAGIEEEIAKDIQSILEETHGDFDSAAMGEETDFHPHSYYEERPASDDAWQEAWSEFERSLKTEARFFSRSAIDHLTSLFSAIDTMATIDNRPLIVERRAGHIALQPLSRPRISIERSPRSGALPSRPASGTAPIAFSQSRPHECRRHIRILRSKPPWSRYL